MKWYKINNKKITLNWTGMQWISIKINLMTIECEMRQGQVWRHSGILRVGLLHRRLPLQTVRRFAVDAVDAIDVFVDEIFIKSPTHLSLFHTLNLSCPMAALDAGHVTAINHRQCFDDLFNFD